MDRVETHPLDNSRTTALKKEIRLLRSVIRRASLANRSRLSLLTGDLPSDEYEALERALNEEKKKS